MQKIIIQGPEIKLVGVTARTSNARESQQETAVIWQTIQKYFSLQGPEKILHSTHPGVTYSVYTDYESDYTGEYTYFFGQQVSEFDSVPEGLSILIIPAQKYVKFTSEPGVMPQVCFTMWQNIWQMSDAHLGGTRAYIADFEIYDERARDPQAVVLDIYIGIK